MKVAEVITRILEDEGIEAAFGIPGAAINPVYEYLGTSEQITHYLARHEEGAVHAADGYFRASGRLALAICTSGPGATNFVNYQDISADPARKCQTYLSGIDPARYGTLSHPGDGYGRVDRHRRSTAAGHPHRGRRRARTAGGAEVPPRAGQRAAAGPPKDFRRRVGVFFFASIREESGGPKR